MKNYVYHYLSKFQLILLDKMRDLVTFLKAPEIETQTQHDLQLPFNNSKHHDILGDILNICHPHFLKISALLMIITKNYHFQKKLISKLRLKL